MSHHLPLNPKPKPISQLSPPFTLRMSSASLTIYRKGSPAFSTAFPLASVWRQSSRWALVELPVLALLSSSSTGFHAAWCWAEHWLPYFSHRGYDCYAVSLLGQGESDMPSGKVAGTLQTHTSEVADFIQEKVKTPPVLIGHSFEGLIVQSYIASTMLKSTSNQPFNSGWQNLPLALAGAALICSVPPSGNRPLQKRSSSLLSLSYD